MLIYEYAVAGTRKQYAAIDEAIRVVQFIRNKCLRKWMDERGASANDLQRYCAVLAKEYSFASSLNSQARQVAADRAWSAIARFYDNCREHKPGKKGYPRFQHDNRSVEYKTTGWKFDLDGKHIRSQMAVALVGFDWLAIRSRRLKHSLSRASSGYASSSGPMDTTFSLPSKLNVEWSMLRLVPK